MTLRESFEKILRNERLLEEERSFFLDWAQRAENLSIGVNPLTGQVTVLNTGPTQPEIQAMVDTALRGRQTIPTLAEISNQAGLLIAGEFRSGNSKVPGDGFTGGRFGWPGFTYGGTTYFLAGVNNDTLQVGLSLTDGKVYAGAGAVVLDATGIVATAGTIGGWVLGADSIKDAAGVVGLSSAVTAGTDMRFWAGHTDPSAAPFHVDEAGALFASNATITGYISATSGNIGGWNIGSTSIWKTSLGVGIVIDSATPKIQVGDTGGIHIVIDGANQRIRSSNFVAGQAGSNWNTATGDAEFNNITARGELKTFLFTASNQMAVAGNILISKDAGKLGADVSSGATTVNFGKALTVGDWIKIQGPDDAGSNNLEWMLIGSLVSGTTYNVTRNVDGTGANGWLKDTPFVVIGASGDSRIELVAGASGSIQLITQGATWNTQTVQASMSTTAGAITAGGGNILLDSTGIKNIATGLLADSNGYKFVDTADPTKILGGVYSIARHSPNFDAYVELRAAPQDGTLATVYASVDSVASNTAVARLTSDSGLNAGSAAALSVEQTATGRIFLTNINTIDFQAAVVFNETGADLDQRMEGDTDPQVFYLDASTDRIGIGTATPTAKLNVEGDVIFNDAGADKDFRVEGDTDTNLLFLDASLDAIGMGGAAQSGVKLTVTGDAEVTSKLGVGVVARTSLEITGGIYVSSANGNTLGTQYDYTGDDGSFGVNYNGYQDGATKFRDFFIADGKHGFCVFVDGSTNRVGFGGNTAPGYTIDVTGDVNVSGDVRKAGTAYTNPDYALELWATGEIAKHIDKPGAKEYKRLTLAEMETQIRKSYKLPGFERVEGLFSGGDLLLEKVEELYTHLIEMDKRLQKLGV